MLIFFNYYFFGRNEILKCLERTFSTWMADSGLADEVGGAGFGDLAGAWP